MPTPTRPLPSRFRWLVTGAATSGIGDGLVEVALPLLVATRGGSALDVTAVAAAQAIPWLLFGLHAGAAVDRLDLARLMSLIDAVRAVTIGLAAAAVVTDTAVLPAAFVAAFVIGSGDVVVTAGLDTATVRLLDDDQLERGNGRMFTVMTVTQHLLGPALGGVLFRIAGFVPLLVDAITYVASSLIFGRSAPRRGPATETAAPKVTEDIRAGLAWVAQNPPIRRLTGVIVAFSFTHAGVMASLALLVLRRYDGNEAALGAILVVSALGNAIGAAVSERLLAVTTLRVVLTIGGVTVGAGYLVIGATTSVLLAAAAMGVVGVVIGIANVGIAAARQRLVPSDLIGRASSILRMGSWGATPVAAILVGVTADGIGLGAAVIIIGVMQIVVSCILPRGMSADTDQALPESVGVGAVGESA